LEHSRIFYFENSSGSQPHIFAGSADWMPRNFYRRIEAVFPIEDPDNRKRVKALLETYLKDTRHARILRANGSYHKISRKKGSFLMSAQDFFYDQANSKRKAQATEHSEEPEIVPLTEPK
jgi:polyphosphate kinase